MLDKLPDDEKLLALAAAATTRARDNPIDAMLVAGCRPKWHLIVARPNEERVACKHLAGRRFGVYRPCLTRREVIRGRLCEHEHPMFPGYIFVFVWNILAHWRRLRAVPGVARIMMDGDWPVTVPDFIIDEVQGVEAGLLLPMSRNRRQLRKGWRREAKPHEDRPPADRITVSTRGWGNFEGLDDGARNHLLHRALGLV